MTKEIKEKRNYPELPYGLKPEFIYEFGMWLVAYVKDGKYSVRFYWDKISESFNRIEVEMLF